MKIREKATLDSQPLFAELSRKEKELNKIKASIACAFMQQRLALGMNQKAFAEKIGVSQGMVSRIESGDCNFTLESILDLCDKLDLKFEPVIEKRACAQNIVLQGFTCKNNWNVNIVSKDLANTDGGVA